MGIILNEPVTRTFIKTEKQRRKERRLFISPVAESTTDDERLLIDIALNNTVAEDSVLPEEHERSLMLATEYYYQVSAVRKPEEFNKTILVTYDISSNKIRIFIYDKPMDKYIMKQFVVLIPETTSSFITNNLSKTVYLENAARLTKEKVCQYSENIADVYKLLFHVVFQTDMAEFVDTDNIESSLFELLKDTEVTLHLNITRTIKLYGKVDEEKFLNLYIREIGTPDTFWTRSVLLPELVNRFD